MSFAVQPRFTNLTSPPVKFSATRSQQQLSAPQFGISERKWKLIEPFVNISASAVIGCLLVSISSILCSNIPAKKTSPTEASPKQLELKR
jgi:hypothetical protein